QLHIVLTFGIAVVGTALHILRGKQRESRRGGAQLAVGTGKLAAEGGQQVLLRIRRRQRDDELRQLVTQRQLRERPGGAALEPRHAELLMQRRRQRVGRVADQIIVAQVREQLVDRVHRRSDGAWSGTRRRAAIAAARNNQG